MTIDLSVKEFRMLLDMVYIGNWILNSTRGDDRFSQYDDLESKLFALARRHGMEVLAEDWEGTVIPSRAYQQGGIHEVIALYEDTVFYEILAEELARRDMEGEGADQNDESQLVDRMEEYYQEFEAHGIDNLTVEN